MFGSVLVLLVVSAGTPGPSAAQRKEAGIHYERGVVLTKEGNYPAALAEFRAAYQAAPSFEVLFNIGLCERRSFKYGQALRTFAEYLKQGGPKVPADRRQAVAKEIEQIRVLTAPVAVIVDGEPALITIDGEREGMTPLTELVPLGPGKHVVRAEREGDVPEERSITVVSGQAQAVQFTLKSLSRPVEVTLETQPQGAMISIDGAEPVASPRVAMLKPGSHEVVARKEGYSTARTDVVVQPGEARSVRLELSAVPVSLKDAPPRPFPVLGVSLLGGGVLAAGIGAFFAVQAGSSAEQLTSATRNGAITWDDSWVKVQRAGQGQQLAAQVLLGVGGALVAAGAVWTVLSLTNEPEAPHSTFLVLPTTQGVAASWLLTF